MDPWKFGSLSEEQWAVVSSSHLNGGGSFSRLNLTGSRLCYFQNNDSAIHFDICFEYSGIP